jgi:hypothetical protein
MAGREAILAAYGGSFDLLLGRRICDLWSGFWPKAPRSFELVSTKAFSPGINFSLHKVAKPLTTG